MRITPQISIKKTESYYDKQKPVIFKSADETSNDKKDSSSVSKSGVKLQSAFSQNRSNAIMGLEDRKGKIEQSKKEFLERAKAKGMDSKEVAEKLKEYEQEINSIDQQISQIKIEEQKNKLGFDKEKLEKVKEKQASNPNKTTEQVEKQEAQNFINLSQGMDNVKSAISLRQKLSDTAKVIERQIASDIGTGSGTSIYSDMLNEVNEKIASLSVAIGESMNELESAVKAQSKLNTSQGDDKINEDNEKARDKNTSSEIKTLSEE